MIMGNTREKPKTAEPHRSYTAVAQTPDGAVSSAEKEPMFTEQGNHDPSRHNSSLLLLIASGGILVSIFLMSAAFESLTSQNAFLTLPAGTTPPEPTAVTLTNTETTLVISDPTPLPGASTRIQNIQEQEDGEFYGQSVTLIGTFEQSVEGWGFTLHDPNAPEHRILVVVTPDQLPDSSTARYQAEPGDQLEVTGVVKELTTQFEQENGFSLELLPSSPWINQAVLLANRIEVTKKVQSDQ